MKCRPILVDDTLRELTQHGTPDFPLSMDRQVVADPCHGGVRHWHPEVQIALVTQGEVVFRTEDGDFRLRAGQGFSSTAASSTRPCPPRQPTGCTSA